MEHVFEVVDKSGRKIHLSNERWKHILKHNNVNFSHLEDVKSALTRPTHAILQAFDKTKGNYYLYNKQMKNYLLVVVKYLNGNGYVITVFFTKNIQNER